MGFCGRRGADVSDSQAAPWLQTHVRITPTCLPRSLTVAGGAAHLRAGKGCIGRGGRGIFPSLSEPGDRQG